MSHASQNFSAAEIARLRLLAAAVEGFLRKDIATFSPDVEQQSAESSEPDGSHRELPSLENRWLNRSNYSQSALPRNIDLEYEWETVVQEDAPPLFNRLRTKVMKLDEILSELVAVSFRVDPTGTLAEALNRFMGGLRRIQPELDTSHAQAVFWDIHVDVREIRRMLDKSVSFRCDALMQAFLALEQVTRELLKPDPSGLLWYSRAPMAKFEACIDQLPVDFPLFLKHGIPAILSSQQPNGQLVNLATIATFFSSVTATTLQLSSNNTSTPLANAVNGFFFSSLVFSAAAAVLCLISLESRQYRGVPAKQLISDDLINHILVKFWLEHAPFVFLMVSIAAFMIGLCLYAWSTQIAVVYTLTTAITLLTSHGLLIAFAVVLVLRIRSSKLQGIAEKVLLIPVSVLMIPFFIGTFLSSLFDGVRSFVTELQSRMRPRRATRTQIVLPISAPTLISQINALPPMSISDVSVETSYSLSVHNGRNGADDNVSVTQSDNLDAFTDTQSYLVSAQEDEWLSQGCSSRTLMETGFVATSQSVRQQLCRSWIVTTDDGKTDDDAWQASLLSRDSLSSEVPLHGLQSSDAAEPYDVGLLPEVEPQDEYGCNAQDSDIKSIAAPSSNLHPKDSFYQDEITDERYETCSTDASLFHERDMAGQTNGELRRRCSREVVSDLRCRALEVKDETIAASVRRHQTL